MTEQGYPGNQTSEPLLILLSGLQNHRNDQMTETHSEKVAPTAHLPSFTSIPEANFISKTILEKKYLVLLSIHGNP